MGEAVIRDLRLHPQVRGEDDQTAGEGEDFVELKESRHLHKAIIDRLKFRVATEPEDRIGRGAPDWD